MIYSFLKRIITITLFVFFKKIIVTGKEKIPSQGPMIIVANHPNTLMDPLIIASIEKQRLGFIANGGIFFNKLVNKILTHLHVIPIYREKDRAPGEKQDNRKTFEKCHEYLNKGGTILIFPEGSSYYELNLREIKTGTARIALSFEDLLNFDGGLKILPIALDYSDSLQFRSVVSVTVSQPISVSDYREIHKEEELKAIRKLTEDLRSELAKNVAQTSGKQQEAFLIRAHKFYVAYDEPSANLYHNPEKSLELRTTLSEGLQGLQQKDNKLYQAIERELHSFFNALEKEKLTTGFFTEKYLRKNPIWILLGYSIRFILLLPIYIFGLGTNYIPYILPYRIFRLLKIDIEYKAPVQMIIGLTTFPLFYGLELWLFRLFISRDIIFSILFLFTLAISGYITMYYWLVFKRFIRIIRFYFKLKPNIKSDIIKQRDHLLEQLENARKQVNPEVNSS